MPCGFEMFFGYSGLRQSRVGPRRPKAKRFKGSKAAKKASRRRS